MDEKYNFILENEATAPIVPTTADSMMIMPNRERLSESKFTYFSRNTRIGSNASALGGPGGF